jgi:uncharacterized protein (TIGR02452 family)
MNRHQLAALAEDTLQILEQGGYRHPLGQTVSIAERLRAAVANTKLYQLADFPATLTPPAEARRFAHPIIEVTLETTLAAAQRLVNDNADDEPLCLNFASAKKPGGGFRTGAVAQEESLARASGLYPCLMQGEAMYEYNRRLSTTLYSDLMIYAPGVPVFRDDANALLAEPSHTAFITAPAVNAGVIRRQEIPRIPQIRPVMTERLRKVLWVAWRQGHTRLVLGAWGCGVFGNDPYEMADLFAEALLAGGEFHGVFAQVVFAIYDRTNNRASFAPFERRFRV